MYLSQALDQDRCSQFYCEAGLRIRANVWQTIGSVTSLTVKSLSAKCAAGEGCGVSLTCEKWSLFVTGKWPLLANHEFKRPVPCAGVKMWGEIAAKRIEKVYPVKTLVLAEKTQVHAACRAFKRKNEMTNNKAQQNKTYEGEKHISKASTRKGEGYCCDRKARAACAQSFTLWQQATTEITRHDHSIIAWFAPHTLCMDVILHAHSTQRQWRGCNSTNFYKNEHEWRINRHIAKRTIFQMKKIRGFKFSEIWDQSRYNFFRSLLH